MYLALQERNTDALGDLKAELAARINTEAENTILRKQLEESTEGVPHHTVDEMKEEYKNRLKGFDMQHRWDTQTIHDTKRQSDGLMKQKVEYEDELGQVRAEGLVEIDKLKKRNQDLEKEVSQLKSSHGSLMDEMSQEKKKTSDLAGEVEDLKEEKNRLESGKSREIADLQLDLDSAKRRIGERDASLEQCEKDNSELREAANSKVDDKKIQRDLEAKDERIKRLGKELKRVKAEYDSLVQVVEKLEIKNKDLKDEMENSDTLQDIISTLNRQIEGFKVSMQENEDEIKELRFKLETSATLRDGKLKAEMEESAQAMVEARQERDNALAKAKKLEKVIRKHEDANYSLRQSAAALSEEKNELDADIKKLQNEVYSRSYDLKVVSENCATEKESLKAEILRLTSLANTARDQLRMDGEDRKKEEAENVKRATGISVGDRERLIEEHDGAKTENDQAKADWVAIKGRLQAKNEAAEKLSQQLEAVNDRYATALEAVSKLENEHNELQENYSKLRDKYNKLKDKYNELKENYNELENSTDAENAGLRTELSRFIIEEHKPLAKEYEELVAKNTRLRATALALAGQMDEIAARHAQELGDQVDAAYAEETRLTTDLTQAGEELKETRKNLRKCHEEAIILRKELKNCQNKGRGMKEVEKLKDQAMREGSGRSSRGLSSANRLPPQEDGRAGSFGQSGLPGSPGDAFSREVAGEELTPPMSTRRRSRGQSGRRTPPAQIIPSELSPINTQGSRMSEDSRDSTSPTQYNGPQPFRDSLNFAITRCNAELRATRDERAQHGFRHGDVRQAQAAAKEIYDASLLLPLDDSERQSFLAKGAYLQGIAYYYGDEPEHARVWFLEAGELDPEEYPADVIDSWQQRIKEGGPNREAAYYKDPKRREGKRSAKPRSQRPKKDDDDDDDHDYHGPSGGAFSGSGGNLFRMQSVQKNRR
jgi:chromosome segregation ATPase